MTPTIRQLHLRGALGAVRTEMWDGREHLVVPVVALQEAVIHAVNAAKPELVLASSLHASVGKWNGHPLVVGHPVRDGKQVSAHDPAVLAQHGFGFIRQATMNGTRLGMEAMVDPSRLTTLKQEQLLSDLRAGKPIEVSVGAFVTMNDKAGTHGGKNYDGEWMGIEPDHLAFLPGGTGACSIAMGCGAHRAASYLVTAEAFEAETESAADKFTAFLRTLMPRGWGDDEVKQELREALYEIEPQARNGEVVRVTNDAIIYCIYPMPLSAVEYPNAYPIPKIHHFRRDYSFADGKFSISMDREEVEPATVYEPKMLANPEGRNQYSDGGGAAGSAAPKGKIGFMAKMRSRLREIGEELQRSRDEAAGGTKPAGFGKTRHKAVKLRGMSADEADKALVSLAAELTTLAATKDCPTCHGTGQIKDGDSQQDCTSCDGTGVLKTAELKAACGCETTEAEMKTKVERIAALLANEHNPVKDLSDKTSDEVLTVLEAQAVTNATTAATHATALKAAQDAQAATEAALKAAQASQIPAEELTSLRALAAERDARNTAEKADLVTKLVAASKVLSKEQLEAKSLDDLSTLASFANVQATEPVDFSGRGTPRVAAQATIGGDFTPPDPWEAGIKTLQGKATVN